MATSNIIAAIGPKKKDTVLSSSTKIIETISLIRFSELKYFINFEGNSEVKSMEVTVQKRGSQIFSSIGNRIGVGIDLIVNPKSNGLNFEMEITNNEGFDVALSYARLTI